MPVYIVYGCFLQFRSFLVEKSADFAQEIARKTAERVADMGGLSEVDKVEMLEEMEK